MKRQQIEKIIDALTEIYIEATNDGDKQKLQEIGELLEYWHKKIVDQDYL